jgi:foldase protein PrsA
VPAKSGQSKKSAGRSAGRKRLAVVVFAVLLVGLFVGFAVAQGIGQPSVPAGAVAIVKGVPSDLGTVTEGEFKKALLQQVGQSGLKKVPKQGEKKYEELKTATMTELLSEVWIQGEAEELGLSVTPKQVATQFAQVKKTNFPTPKAYKQFLKESHFTQEDVNNRVKIQLLSTQVQEAVSRSAVPASNAEIADYYEAEKNTQFTTKPSRDIRVIINKKKSEVEKAKAALEKDNSPKGWKKVAAKYSTDPSTKGSGGLQQGVTEEFVKGALKNAIFGPPTGQLTGPVKYETNYFLVEVVKLNPEKVKPLGEVKKEISTTLNQKKQEEAFSEFVAGYQSKWTSRTYCASGFETESCSNYVGSGHPKSAVPGCYEANPKPPPAECPAPVAQLVPAMPGTVTIAKPKGEPLPQRPQPPAAASPAGGAALPEGATAPPPSSGE